MPRVTTRLSGLRAICRVRGKSGLYLDTDLLDDCVGVCGTKCTSRFYVCLLSVSNKFVECFFFGNTVSVVRRHCDLHADVRFATISECRLVGGRNCRSDDQKIRERNTQIAPATAFGWFQRFRKTGWLIIFFYSYRLSPFPSSLFFFPIDLSPLGLCPCSFRTPYFTHTIRFILLCSHAINCILWPVNLFIERASSNPADNYDDNQ